jgi:hypothetical protein
LQTLVDRAVRCYIIYVHKSFVGGVAMRLLSPSPRSKAGDTLYRSSPTRRQVASRHRQFVHELISVSDATRFAIVTSVSVSWQPLSFMFSRNKPPSVTDGT